MHYPGSPWTSALLVFFLLCCTGISSAASSDHPVVTSIVGPNNLDNGYGPTGSYTFIASVSGGSPPYTYKWMNPPGVRTLFEGKEYASVKIPATQLFTGGGPGHYGVWLTVTDSAGKDAIWEKAGGTGNSNQYSYSLTYTDAPAAGWTVTTEPKTFPKSAGTPAAEVTKEDTCIDAGARFSGVSGQVMLSREGRPDDWKIAKVDSILCEGDRIETDEDATCIISFADMSTYVMKPETIIILAKKSGPESKLKLVAGKIWMNIRKMVKDGSMEVDMDQGICGIRGTTLVLGSDAGSSTLQVVEGTVSMTGKADKKTILVSTGQQATATPQGTGDPTPFDTASVTTDWEAVKAKTLAGSPAEAPTQKSGSGPVAIAGIGVAAAILLIRRME
jgi:hypothetical protein